MNVIFYTSFKQLRVWSSIFQTNTKNSDEVIFSLSFLLVSNL